jgi:hypothetical protein
MRTFLFAATGPQGQNVTDNIDAETLSQARYKLELRGFTAVEFLQGELCNDIIDTFGEDVKTRVQKNPSIQEVFARDSSLTTYFKVMLKLSAIVWAPVVLWMAWSRSNFSFISAGILLAIFIYFSVPTVLYTLMINSVFMANRRQALFWIAATRAFGHISFLKIPECELDMRRATLDAQAGNVEMALARVAKYAHDPKVSRRVYLSYLYSLNTAAKQYDEALRYQAQSIGEGNDFPEELLDHALTLARKRETAKAREFVERALDKEASLLVSAFIPLTQGIIEVQDGNFPRAEFYLREAQRRMDPFRHNTFLIGSRSLLNAFLSIVLKAKGEIEEATRLFELARPYLEAHKETELLARSSPGK